MRKKVKKVKYTIMISEEISRRLEDYRRAQPAIPSKSMAIESLLDYALREKGF